MFTSLLDKEMDQIWKEVRPAPLALRTMKYIFETAMAGSGDATSPLYA
jgi:hypothetical protein